MENARTSILSSLFPWLAPLTIKFEVVNGGVSIQLYRNQQMRENWQPSDLRRVLPQDLIQWMEHNRIHQMLQPYPVAKQFWQAVFPCASKKLVIDVSALANLEEVDQTTYQIVLIWELQRATEWIVGRFDGADRYLGLGWFQTGNRVWSLPNQLSTAVDAQLKNLTLPLHQANHLLTTIIPGMNQFLPTCADFQLITDFAPQVIVADARSGGLILQIQCNYPRLLATLQTPQQTPDELLAEKAIIIFPQQVRAPVLMQLLQSRLSITVQGADVPQIIREQLPIMRQYHQISDEMADKITQANPIVPVAALKPALSFTHMIEHGLGKYALMTKYFYNQREIDMVALLAAHQRGQRFIQQHNIWFEWPSYSHELAQNIHQQLVAQVLLPEEVMGFDTRRTAALAQKPATTLRPSGSTPFERGQTLFKQLQQHGIPGGIIGETGTTKMFVSACEQLWHDNRYAPMLWLVPSNKKGAVTRAVNSSTIGRYITVASLVTLRDEPALFSRQWMLVIFQDLDHLLDGSFQASMLPQLRWQWALTSASSIQALRPSAMRILHLSEQYFGQFCAKYLFDLEKSYEHPLSNQKASGWNAAQASPSIPPKSKTEQFRAQPEFPPAKPTFENARPILRSARYEIELNQQKIVQLHEEADLLRERLTIGDEEQVQPVLLASASEISIAQELAQTPVQADEGDNTEKTAAYLSASEQRKPRSIPSQTPDESVPARVASVSASAPSPVIRLDAQAISKLHEEADHLQERLLYETAAHPAVSVSSMLDTPLEPVPTTPDVNAAQGNIPADVDEDWLAIAQKWKAEHWEIIVAVLQGRADQVEAVAHRVQRPGTRLIDEINEPVAEQWDDVLIEPEALTIPDYFYEEAEKLTHWYLSSRAS